MLDYILAMKTLQEVRGSFVGKFSKMGDKRIIIVPIGLHKDIDKILGKHIKVSWEEVL